MVKGNDKSIITLAIQFNLNIRTQEVPVLKLSWFVCQLRADSTAYVSWIIVACIA